MKKLLSSMAVVTVMLVAFTGCSATSSSDGGTSRNSVSGDLSINRAHSFIQELPDGYEVICVQNLSTGLTCDWDNKTKTSTPKNAKFE